MTSMKDLPLKIDGILLSVCPWIHIGIRIDWVRNYKEDESSNESLYMLKTCVNIGSSAKNESPFPYLIKPYLLERTLSFMSVITLFTRFKKIS